jgi:hypothetical protein
MKSVMRFLDMIYKIYMIVVPRVARRKIWSAVTRAALRAGRGTAFATTLPPDSCLKAASRGIPLAAAFQILSSHLRSRCHPALNFQHSRKADGNIRSVAYA